MKTLYELKNMNKWDRSNPKRLGLTPIYSEAVATLVKTRAWSTKPSYKIVSITLTDAVARAFEGYSDWYRGV